MKTYTLKAFGAARDIMGGREIALSLQAQTVAELRAGLLQKYPSLAGLRSLMIAVNNEYADDNLSIQEHDEIAIIPPVSGG